MRDRVRADLDEARAALAKNAMPDAEVVARLKAALLTPLEKELADDSLLFLATADVGGPVPSLWPLATANLSVPSALELVKGAQLVGVAGQLALAATEDGPLVEADRRLPGEDLRSAFAVHVGRVDEVDAGVDRAADQHVDLRLFQLADLAPDAGLTAAKSHRPEAQLGHEQSRRTKPGIPHPSLD